MSGRALLPADVSPTWRYALAGGLASIPLTLFEYWRSGMGDHMSLSTVVVGALVAGYLAAGRVDDVAAVGLRAGLVGALPGLWLSAQILGWALGPVEPPWFRVAGIVGAVVVTAFLFLVSGVVGFVGGKAGGWLAGKTGRRRSAAAGW